MARPERNTVDYYPHLVGEGKKMYFIDKKYGNDGYATWFKILDKLAVTEYHYLNLNKEEEVMFLASKCNITEDRLISIITDLVKLGKFDKEMWDFKIIWDQSFIDSIQEAYKKRNNNCISLTGLRILLTGLGILKVIENPLKVSVKTQTIEEYSKVKKSRVISDASPSDSVYTKCMKLYDDFISQKTGVGAKINSSTGSALKKIIAYLTTQVKNKDDLLIAVPGALEYVFKNYESWDPFHKGQLNLNQIESNLINILNSIRNGKPNTKNQPQSKYAPQ